MIDLQLTSRPRALPVGLWVRPFDGLIFDDPRSVAAQAVDHIPCHSLKLCPLTDDAEGRIEPGAGRLFGLLSVSALPRRLSLDFSDVFQKGLAFDSLGGDFQLYEGDAFTDSLALSGPAAKILIVGRTGIAKRDYDQIAVVSTNIGRSLVLSGAFAAGPGVGAAVWLFSEIFKDPLTDISRVSYQITGSWDDPKIERVAAEDQELAQGESQ